MEQEINQDEKVVEVKEEIKAEIQEDKEIFDKDSFKEELFK